MVVLVINQIHIKVVQIIIATHHHLTVNRLLKINREVIKVTIQGHRIKVEVHLIRVTQVRAAVTINGVVSNVADIKEIIKEVVIKEINVVVISDLIHSNNNNLSVILLHVQTNKDQAVEVQTMVDRTVVKKNCTIIKNQP